MKPAKLFALIISALFSTFANAGVDDIPPILEISTYPFIATPERAEAIRRGLTHIDVGMSRPEIATVLGEPDEVYPLYVPRHKHGKVIGYTQWYIVQRLVKNGSANQKQESLLRLTFSLSHKVSKIDSWGL